MKPKPDRHLNRFGRLILQLKKNPHETGDGATHYTTAPAHQQIGRVRQLPRNLHNRLKSVKKTYYTEQVLNV